MQQRDPADGAPPRPISPETLVTHQPQPRLPPRNEPLVGPIYQSVKFTFPTEDMAAVLSPPDGGEGGYVYSRAGNPTVRQLERLLAELQGRQDALCVGSGVAAVSSPLLSILRAGDHVAIFAESYKPSRVLVRSILGRFGVTCSVLHIDDLDALEALLRGRPVRAILFETPSNPTLKIADLPRLTALARRAGALTILDNTFAGFHNHGAFDVDLYVHSLTKYAAGHGDVMGGAVIGDRELIRSIREDAITLGPTLDPHAAFLVLRGMKTYFLRYRRQSESALHVARWLEAHPRVHELRHPGLPSHPQRALAARQMSDFGGVVSFVLRGGPGADLRLIDRLRLFRFAGSLGSTESLIAPAHRFFAGDLTPEQALRAGLPENAIRLSVGIEDPADLIADLEQALEET